MTEPVLNTDPPNTSDSLPAAPAALPLTGRLHALDALRAAALLLGVFFHAALSYIMLPGEWGVGTYTANLPLWWLVHYAHDFRMEIFFMLAGFFACVVIEKRGIKAFLRDRAVRIAGVFIALLYPLKLLNSLPWISGGLKTGWLELPAGVENVPVFDLAVGNFALERFPEINLGHLWFLYYLAWITGFFVIGRALALKISGSRAAEYQTRIGNGFAKLVGHWSAPLWIALAVTPVLLLTPRLTLDSPDKSFALDWRAVALYGCFFFGGWWLRRRMELLHSFAQRWQALVIFSVLVSVLAFSAEVQRAIGNLTLEMALFAAFANALTLSLAALGWTGFFVSKFSQPAAWVRYLADSSYWVYLIHLPIVIALQVLVADWEADLVGWLVISAVTFAVTLLTYEGFVRYTWIGEWLNGRRYTRASKVVQPVEAG